MHVLLISANTEKINMPTLPIGLGCVAAALIAAGHTVRFLDLLSVDNWPPLLAEALYEAPQVIGVSIRNIIVPEEDAVPGTVIAIQIFGDFLGWHPHLHVLCTDGCFYGNPAAAGFRVAPLFELKHLEAIFRHKVFKMLLSRKKITEDLNGGIPASTSSAGQEFSQTMKMPWRTWPGTLFAPPFPRRE